MCFPGLLQALFPGLRPTGEWGLPGQPPMPQLAPPYPGRAGGTPMQLQPGVTMPMPQMRPQGAMGTPPMPQMRPGMTSAPMPQLRPGPGVAAGPSGIGPAIQGGVQAIGLPNPAFVQSLWPAVQGAAQSVGQSVGNIGQPNLPPAWLQSAVTGIAPWFQKPPPPVVPRTTRAERRLSEQSSLGRVLTR